MLCAPSKAWGAGAGWVGRLDLRLHLAEAEEAGGCQESSRAVEEW